MVNIGWQFAVLTTNLLIIRFAFRLTGNISWNVFRFGLHHYYGATEVSLLYSPHDTRIYALTICALFQQPTWKDIRLTSYGRQLLLGLYRLEPSPTHFLIKDAKQRGRYRDWAPTFSFEFTPKRLTHLDCWSERPLPHIIPGISTYLCSAIISFTL